MASTIAIYTGNGTTTDFTVPFDYLSKHFVRVIVDNSLLTGGDYGDTSKDYYFLDKTTVRLKTPPKSGAEVVIRRYTSATDRVVTFKDASILKAIDLDVSSIQTIHIAEEGRDIVNDALFKDADGNWNAKGHRIVNVADPVNPQDAVTKKHLDTQLENIKATNEQLQQYHKEALEAKDRAVEAETNAKTSEVNSKQSEVKASASAGTAVSASKATELARQEVDNNLKEARVLHQETIDNASQAKASADKAKISETNSKTSETNAKESELRAKSSEDMITELAGTVAEDINTAGNTQIGRVTAEGNKQVTRVTQEGTTQVNNVIKQGGTQVNLAKAQVTLATQQAELATTKANEADDSATMATQKATEAQTSATNSANSAKTATEQATIATTQAGLAKTNADEAKLARDASATSERNAKTSETNAKVSETNAKESELKAKQYADQATAGQLQADWEQTDSTKNDFIKNKPTLGTLSSKNSLAYSELTGVPSSFTPSSHTHTISQITNLQASLDAKTNDVDLQVDLTAIRESITNVSSKVEDKLGVSTVHITETWRSTDGNSRYHKWSDGFIEQWGLLYGSGNGGTVTFPKRFSNTKYIFVVTPNEEGTSGQWFRWLTDNKTTSSIHSILEGGGNDNAPNQSWYAAGF